VVSEGEDRNEITKCVSDVRKKATLGGNQRRRIVQACFSSTGHKQPVTDRALIGNGLYKPVTDRFNICNGLYLTSVTKNLCNGRLRIPLPEVHIGNGRCGGQPQGRPTMLIGNGRQTTTVTKVGACNGR
jgi:hypothetical protein